MTQQAQAKQIKFRWLFGCILVGLMLQFLFRLYSQELYPAIVYPPFRALAVTQGQLRPNKPEVMIESKGQAPVIVEAARLSQSLPESFVDNVLATIKERATQNEKRVRLNIGPLSSIHLAAKVLRRPAAGPNIQTLAKGRNCA